jgi:hypothetical protein
MSALIRAAGNIFNVDSFLKDSPFIPTKVFRAGEPRFPASKPNGPFHTSSGLNVKVSLADFDDYEAQMKDAFYFMRDHADEIVRLRDFEGVEGLGIDFGADIYPPGFSSFRFPHQLLLMAGKLRVDLELSVYPSDSKDDEQEAAERTRLDESYDEFRATERKTNKS